MELSWLETGANLLQICGVVCVSKISSNLASMNRTVFILRSFPDANSDTKI